MPRAIPVRTIQSYNLFGEKGDLPDVVHCETIAARSVLHDWEFAPHRHARLHQILLIARGGGQATLEGRHHQLRPMQVVNVPIGQVHGFSFTHGTEGWVVTFAAEVLDEVLHPAEGLRRALSEAAVLRASPQMRKLMKDIFAEFGGRQFARAHILRALSAMLLGLVARALSARRPTATGGRSAELLARFEALLDAHMLDHWSVTDYADALRITPPHLSRITRQAFGNSASQFIRERLIREARRNLVYTNLSVANVAYALGFDDPAYFSRVFAAETGLSPREFRSRIQASG